jgi:hypothetical protein
MVETHRSRKWLGRLVAVILVAAWAAPSPAPAQSPCVGEVQRLTVVTLSLEVGSTEKDIRQVTYTPPPGWYVRSHTVDCTRKYGHSSYSISTVPQDWSWCSEEQVNESYKTLIDLAAKAHNKGIQGELTLERDQRLHLLRSGRTSHHALVVEATAKGEGFLKGGGGLELTVTAELVYVGTEEDLARVIGRHRAQLEAR